MLTSFDQRTEKDGPAWSPVRLSTLTRSNANVETITALVFDLDGSEPPDLQGLSYVAHTTFTPGSWRLVLPVDREILPEEYATVRANVIERFGIPADPATKDLSRLYYLPTCQPGQTPDNTVQVGEPLKVDDYVKSGFLKGLKKHALPRLEEINLDSLRERLSKSDRADVKSMLAGESVAEPGARDDSLQKLASAVAFSLPTGVPIDAALELFVPSISAMDCAPEGKEYWLNEVRDMLSRAQNRKALKDQEKHALQEILNKRAVDESLKVTEKACLLSADSKYTDEQLEQFAHDQGCSVDEFTKRWIIQYGTAYYIFGPGKYLYPLPKDSVEGSITRDLTAAPIDLEYELKDGGIRRKRVKELVEEYGTVARQVEGSFIAQHSYYNPVTQTFVEAFCPIRNNIEPKEDPQISTWLSLFCPTKTNKLLDWLATCHLLQRQTSALYLSGPPGVGKTLLANGLARLWINKGAPVNIEDAISDFNSALIKCPLIFADEYLPDKKHLTGTLRRLIGSPTITVNRKFLPTCTIEGSPRLILAANNEDLLSNLQESLGVADLEAISQRFLAVKGSPEAVEYLKFLTPTVTNTWITEDKLAAHVLWLAGTRKVESTGRFLVAGETTEVHRQLLITGYTGAVCEWLVKLLSSTGPIPSEIGKYMEIGNGQLLVSTSAFDNEHRWESFIGRGYVRSTSKIGKALKNVSTGVKKTDKVMFYIVKPELIFEWCEVNGAGDVGAIKARLNASR